MVQIPYFFRCPISLELMQDPVTVSTGQTYDRTSIESWVATGNDTCPVTRAPLTDFTLIPNHTLRRLIQEWCVAHRHHGVERIPTPKQPADPSLIRSLISQSSTPSNDLSTRLVALRRIRSLSRESDKNRATISSLSDVRSAVIGIAFENLDPRSYLSSEALALLAVVSMNEAEGLGIVMADERLEYLTSVMRDEELGWEMRVNAGAVVEAAATAARAAAAVGAAEGVMESYVWMVRQRESARGVRVGIKGVFCLCLGGKENRRRAVSAGAAAAVMRRVGELKEGELERGLAAVELMCRVEGGREAVAVSREGAVGALVRAMRAGERAAEHAAGVLVAVVGGSEAMQREAVEEGVVRELLVVVQGAGSERAKRKAQALLKLVSTAWGDTVEREIGQSEDFYFHHHL